MVRECHGVEAGDNLWESVLFFCHVVTRLGGRHLRPLSCLDSPDYVTFKTCPEPEFFVRKVVGCPYKLLISFRFRLQKSLQVERGCLAILCQLTLWSYDNSLMCKAL